jgi:hypothetical protein
MSLNCEPGFDFRELAANSVIISKAFTSSVLQFKVYAHRTLLTDDYVGDMKETIGILAGAEGGGTPTFLYQLNSC